MSQEIHSLMLGSERDVVSARQRARVIAETLGFDHHDQIRIATAVSEIARNAFRYARGGAVSFTLDETSRLFSVVVTDQGGGIPHLDDVLGGSYRSKTGMGMGLLGTKRLMDAFSIETTRSGTKVQFGKLLPHSGQVIDGTTVQRVAAELKRQHPATPIDELQTQNRELLRTLNELRERKEELAQLNSELQDTNRGVVALYAELDERADYLRRASELKTSFLSNMSHEFRTPLNSMLALTRMLLDRMDGELSSEQDQQIRFIQKSAHELSEMVDDLLDLAKVEAGRLEVKPKSFDAADLFGALRGMLKPLLADSSLNLLFEVSEDLPPLFTDEQKVSQVLRNFISNAIKFTPRGEVRVTARKLDATIEFSVADTGIGISESDLQVIFEEFAQIDSSMQRRVKGTGLGLPLSRKLAELLGGTVEVRSIVGQGSTFILRVPTNYRGSAPPTEIELPAMDPAKKFVLIVEDNSETAFVYGRYLSAAGFQPLSVSSVDQAKQIISKVRPSAVILDLLLRAETSWNFLRELKDQPNSIPVLVMSVSDDERKIYGLGADAYLAKPFLPEEMIAAVRKMTSTISRPRILMIDDNEVSRYLLRGQISDSHYEIFEARDGREGLRMAHEIKPNIIFLDFYMPGLNGMEVLKDLRNSKDLQKIPVVLHSTKVLDGSELEFFRENTIAIFPKQNLTLPDAGMRVRELMNTLAAHARKDAAMPESVSRGRVLIIDDQEQTRYIFRHILTRAGYSVEEAETGTQGLAMAMSFPDLIISDVNLPDMLGYDVCRRLRSNPSTVSIPILQISASFVSDESKVQALDGGADSYLTQPVEPTVLLAQVNALLRLRRAETLSSLSSRQWQTTFDGLSDGLALVDSEGNVLRANRTFLELLLLTASEVEGSSIASVFESRFEKRFNEFLEEATTGETVEVSWNSRWFKARFDDIESDLPNGNGAVFLVTEITDHKKLLETMKMSERLAATGRLAHIIAHEINNPLEAMSNLLFLSLQGTPEGNDIHGYLTQATTELVRISEITKQILAYHRESKIPVFANSGELLDGTLAMFRSQMLSNRIEVISEIRCNRPLKVYPGEIRQVFGNLISNAVDAMRGSGGRLITRCVQSSDQQTGAKGVRFLFSDSGPGIPEPIVPRIFHAFYTTKETNGSGIGLWLSAEVIKKHGGTIRVRTRTEGPYRGTLIEVFIRDLA